MYAESEADSLQYKKSHWDAGYKHKKCKYIIDEIDEELSKVFNLEISQEKLQKNSIEVFREINNLKMIFNSQKYHIREHDLMIVNNDKKPVPTINNQINDFKKTKCFKNFH